MTSSRVIRGTKAKFFFYICAILVITGLIACYNNSLSQLDEVKKSNEICHQQQENLSTQLQVISDYKQKLEKSLKNEKAEHQQSKSNLETKINEEKSKSEKLSSDALLKYNSLQQHYNLLKTQHEDFQDECSKSKKKQNDEINQLQLKLKELQQELKKVQETKENIKTQFTEIELENHKLKEALNEKAINNEAQQTINFFSNNYHELEDKYNALKKKCLDTPQDTLPEPSINTANKPSEKTNLNLPAFKGAEKPSSSTKSGPKASSGSLNGARPLVLPSVTPDTSKKEVNLKPPQGVPAVPEHRENQNEQPEIQQQKKIEKDDADKDNAAQEVFDLPQNNVFDGIALGDDLPKDGQKNEESLGLPNKKHDELEYKELQHEEEGEDDDTYGEHLPRQADPIVRN